MRKIVVNGQQWRFKIGTSYVKLLPPTGRSIVVSLTQLTGRPSETIERGRHKRTSDGMVTPADVRAFIERAA